MGYWDEFEYDQTLSVLVHAHSKVGKTWFGGTAPAPRLILDAEGGTKWLPVHRTVWDPRMGPPPTPDGTWDTCIVYVRDVRDVELTYQWLLAGQHQFRSIVLDSISEIQKRAKDSIVGLGDMRTQDWGTILTQMEALIRNIRDLTLHPIRPVQAVVLIAFTRERDGRHSPYVQGALAITMPYFLDVIGYLYPQPLEDGTIIRRMLVGPDPQFEAGERVGGRLGRVIDNPNMESMLYTVYGLQPAAPQVAPAGGLYTPQNTIDSTT